jgi:hypothetical protein
MPSSSRKSSKVDPLWSKAIFSALFFTAAPFRASSCCCALDSSPGRESAGSSW